jgi:large subunit ribosomal protein L27
MSHVKAGGTAKNVHDSPGQRLGVKVWGGQTVKTGDIIIRQVGMNKRAGEGTFLSRNFTIHAAKDGVVAFKQRKVKSFGGRR